MKTVITLTDIAIYESHKTRCMSAGIKPMPRLKFDYIMTNGKRHFDLLQHQENSKMMQTKQDGGNDNYSYLI